MCTRPADPWVSTTTSSRFKATSFPIVGTLPVCSEHHGKGLISSDAPLSDGVITTSSPNRTPSLSASACTNPTSLWEALEQINLPASSPDIASNGDEFPFCNSSM